MAIEIVDFPIKNGGSFHSYISSPEGKPPFSYGFPMVFPLKPPFSHGFPMVFHQIIDGVWVTTTVHLGRSEILAGFRSLKHRKFADQLLVEGLEAEWDSNGFHAKSVAKHWVSHFWFKG